MVRGTYGVYKDEVHSIEKCGEGTVYLYPNSESEIDDTYIDEYNIGVYSKVIDSSELTEMYELSSYVDYKGYKISIARETKDEYELWVADCEIAKMLGFDRCDKYAYNMMVKKSDVEVIVEKTPLNW